MNLTIEDWKLVGLKKLIRVETNSIVMEDHDAGMKEGKLQMLDEFMYTLLPFDEWDAVKDDYYGTRNKAKGLA